MALSSSSRRPEAPERFYFSSSSSLTPYESWGEFTNDDTAFIDGVGGEAGSVAKVTRLDDPSATSGHMIDFIIYLLHLLLLTYLRPTKPYLRIEMDEALLSIMPLLLVKPFKVSSSTASSEDLHITLIPLITCWLRLMSAILSFDNIKPPR